MASSADSRPATPTTTTTLHPELGLDAEQQELITKLREWLQPTNFLSSGSEDDPDVERADQVFKDLYLGWPLTEYALHNWEHHVKKAQDDDPQVLQALSTFVAPDGQRLSCGPIHLAAHIGLVSYAGKLLDADPRLVHLKQGGLRPLAIAAKQGQTDTEKLLLNRGADPDSPDHTGHKPLHYCAMHGSLGVARLLLEAGVRPQTETTRYSRSVRHSAGRRTDGETAVQFACARWHGADDGVFETLLPYLRPEDATKCMHSARDVKMLEAILGTGAADVDSFRDGKTKLFKAAENHSTETVQVLLKYGADPNKGCSSGDDDDHHHHHNKQEDEVEEGEKNTSDRENRGGEYPEGPTPIHAFAGCGNALPMFDDEDAESSRQCLRLLLDAGGGGHQRNMPAEPSGALVPALFNLVDADGIARLTEIFVSNGADVNARTRNGNTPAHFACTETPDTINALIRNGADMTRRNSKGMTPLLGLLGRKLDEDLPSETLDCFLSAPGADAAAVDDAGDSCIHHLIRRLSRREWESAHISFFRKLVIAGADLNGKNKAGMPPLLCYSARSSVHKGLFRRLVEEDGLDIDARDGTGTSILGAILKEYEATLEVFKMFVRLGADVNARDNDGSTALHSAVTCLKDPIRCIRILVAEGADYQARNNQGDSLVQLAMTHTREDKVDEVVDYLAALAVPNSDKNSKGQTRLHLSSARLGQFGGGPHPQVARLERCRAKSLSIDVTDDLGATPLHYAAGVCEFNVARLLREGADPTRLTVEGVSPLHITAVARQPNIVGLLLSEYEKSGVLDRFIDLADEGPQKRTALHYVRRSGRPESVWYLISRGANVHVRDSRGLTPLHAALEFPQESRLWPVQHGGASYLIRPSGEERPSQSSQLDGPDGTCDIVAMLVGAGVDVNERIRVDGSELTPLDMAIRDGFGTMVRDLIDQWAAPQNWAEVAEFIDHSGVDADVEFLLEISTGKQIPADDTSQSSRFADIPSEVLRLLGEGKYRAVAEFSRRSSGVLDSDEHLRVLHSILRVLVTRGYTSLLRRVGREGRYLPQIRDELSVDDGDDDDRETLLMVACNRELPSLPIMKLLVEDFGLDVSEASGWEGITYRETNATPPHALARGRHWWQIEALEYLLERGANIEATNSQGPTPLFVAISNQHGDESWTEETVEVHLRRGANPNVGGNEKTPDTGLVASHTAAVTELLLQYGADAKSAANSASLTPAVDLMDEEMVDLLIEAGQDVNLCIDMMRLLLRKGADPFATDTDGTTVLQGILEDRGVIDPILDIPGLDIEHRGKKNRMLLIMASVPTVAPRWDPWRPPSPPAAMTQSGHIMKQLELGAAVDAVDDDGRTALHWFCTMPGDISDECKAAFDAILDRCGPSLLQASDGRGEKPLHLALQARQNVGGQNLDGETPLFVFVSAGWMEDSKNYVSHSEYLGLFLDAGADVTARNGSGATLLHVVAGIRIEEAPSRSRSDRVGDAVALFKRLLELGADPRAEDDEMRTATDRAVARGRTEIVGLFKGEGKKVALDEEEGADGDGDEESEPGYGMV
ncbi:putative ankyrin repeat protein-like protein [Hapsidospora chrysogenum ATCC 11550]|uniref:Putative ankyrin repeat protein-like protein n=1 Tax=Hapsidospora chrysogenum (strain ATCC 11550 / CBS 779.69 / DSM 880 / IAM 14645 / JCM 23072 / IMI 49137) TaxID=857340 RepID=A0A086SWQ0_HAPC1|nr:putative ankyrin repeat protein-like protein [Hapsidospora chrysogenum ATCC 11550]